MDPSLLKNLPPHLYHALLKEARKESGYIQRNKCTEEATAYQPPTTNHIPQDRFTRRAIIHHHVSAMEKYKTSDGDLVQWKDKGELWKGQIVTNLEIVKGMEMIQIEQLKISPNNDSNHPNRGKYLFARICQPCFRMTSILTILENGLTELNTNIVQLAIYNYKLGQSKMNDEFRVGRYVIIKNPFYKIYADEWPGLRIDNSNELFFINDEKIIQQLKQKQLTNHYNDKSNSKSVPSISGNNLSEPPKWKNVVMDFEMTERFLHAGFVYDDSTLIYWGGLSGPKDMLSRQICKTYGELIMIDSYSNMAITPSVSGDIPEPGNRNGHLFIPDYEENFAYLIGGGDGGINDGSFRLCLKTFVWKKLNFQFNLTCSCAASVPGYIFIYGGRQFTKNGFDNVDTLFRYDIKKDKLEKLKNTKPCPSERSKACLASICNGKYLILFGGDKSKIECVQDLWLFDCSSMKWIEISQVNKPKPNPMALSGWSKVKLNGKDRALVFYGGVEITGKVSNEIWSLDLKTLTFEKVLTSSKNMEAICGTCNHVANMRLYVYGGFMKMNQKLSNKVYSFDLSYHFRNSKIMDFELYDWQCVECHSFTSKKMNCCGLSCCSVYCEEKYRRDHPEPTMNVPSHPELDSPVLESLKSDTKQEVVKQSPEMQNLLFEKLSEIENLKKLVLERDLKVKNLENSIGELSEKLIQSNSHYENALSQIGQSTRKHENTIETLTEDKLSMEKNFKLERKELEKKIKEMNEKLQEKTKKIQYLESATQQFEKKVQEMTQINKQLEVEKVKSMKKLEEQSNTIQTLHQSNIQLEERVEDLKRECTKMENQTHQFLCELEEKEKENQNLIEQLAKYYNDLEVMREPNNEQDTKDVKNECTICMDNEADHVSIPCGHMFCLNCITNQVDCASCRGKIESKLKIYLN